MRESSGKSACLYFVKIIKKVKLICFLAVKFMLIITGIRVLNFYRKLYILNLLYYESIIF